MNLVDQQLYIESRAVSHPRSKGVRFGAVDVVCIFENQQNPSPALWYSKREIVTMMREFKTLSRNYDTLSQRHPDVELLGLEDPRVAKDRRSKRRFQIQNTLLQQDVHRRLGIDDPKGIAVLSGSYSKLAKKEALQRGGRGLEDDYESDEGLMANQHNLTSQFDYRPPIISFAASARTTMPCCSKAEVCQPGHCATERRQQQVEFQFGESMRDLAQIP